MNDVDMRLFTKPQAAKRFEQSPGEWMASHPRGRGEIRSPLTFRRHHRLDRHMALGLCRILGSVGPSKCVKMSQRGTSWPEGGDAPAVVFAPRPAGKDNPDFTQISLTLENHCASCCGWRRDERYATCSEAEDHHRWTR